MPCKFCEEYKEIKAYNDSSRKRFKEKGKPIRIYYKICLVEETRRIGWGVVRSAGSHYHKPMKFNYCPVCGKSIMKGAQNDR